MILESSIKMENLTNIILGIQIQFVEYNKINAELKGKVC